MTDGKQWQCGECGAWLDTGWSSHIHVKLRQPSLDEMILSRRMSELGGAVDATSDVATSKTTYFRTFREPTRDTPL